MAVDAKGASEQMQQRAVDNSVQELQKQQENEEQMKALETFKALLQKAGQV